MVPEEDERTSAPVAPGPAMAKMLDAIREELRYTARELGRDRLDPRVEAAIAQVPRHLFVPDHLRDAAYLNGPLPIGDGQTISQPYIVAVMTDLLRLRPGDRVLEVGTGSGYQAAILSRLVDQVYSLELIPRLAAEAEARFRDLGYDNIRVRVGDGYQGWPEAAPFDAIVVTAAAPEVPEPLVRQLAPGRRMVLPVDAAIGQDLLLLEKDARGHLHTRRMLPVAFVPLRGRRADDDTA